MRLDGAEFTRMRVSDPAEQDALVAAIEAALRHSAAARRRRSS